MRKYFLEIYYFLWKKLRNKFPIEGRGNVGFLRGDSTKEVGLNRKEVENSLEELIVALMAN